MNKMRYRNYAAMVEDDAEDRIFIGHLLGIGHIVGFHGSTVEALENAFHDAVDHYLEVCEKIGQKPQKSYSGKLTLRISPETHLAVANAAESNKKALINGLRMCCVKQPSRKGEDENSDLTARRSLCVGR